MIKTHANTPYYMLANSILSYFYFILFHSIEYIYIYITNQPSSMSTVKKILNALNTDGTKLYLRGKKGKKKMKKGKKKTRKGKRKGKKHMKGKKKTRKGKGKSMKTRKGKKKTRKGRGKSQ